MTMTYDAFREKERDGWNARAPRYESATARATLQSIPMLLHLAEIRPGARLLDLGCGPGYLAAAAHAVGAHCTGVDFAPDMLRVARARCPGVEFVAGDAAALPFGDAQFDVVAANFVFFHLADPQAAIAEAARVLRPGGRFVFSQWLGPDKSELYRDVIGAVQAHGDLSRADPAPDAYALSEPETARAALRAAGFVAFDSALVQNVLTVEQDDFFDFFMTFGVRVPAIVEAQTAPVQAAMRAEMNERMATYRTEHGGYDVPMPSILYAGRKP
ncbi:MAG: class I SAM-dependent methyltransferase [Pseudomonadota bacterium]